MLLYVIVATGSILRKSVIRHELVHVKQGMTNGIFQPLMYLLASFIAWETGKSLYHDNAFEQQARREAGEDE